MPNMESSADRVVAALHTVDEKVNAMRDQRLNDPDSFGDKIFKSVVPTLAGLVLGKAFEMVWKKSVGRKAVRADGTKNEAAEAALGIVFAVVSAGFGALVSQLSGRGSKAIVDRRHARHELHDFFLYYMLRFGYPPRKIFRAARKTFADVYDDATIKKWLTTFVRRFFTQQFKRSCLPDGPKVGTVTLSPRGDWRMPSDAVSALWLKEAEKL